MKKNGLKKNVSVRNKKKRKNVSAKDRKPKKGVSAERPRQKKGVHVEKKIEQNVGREPKRGMRNAEHSVHLIWSIVHNV